jgi:hypothetical protein
MQDCECDYGFDCTYTKSIRGKVVLPISPEEFDSVMQENFVHAIAEAAGISRVSVPVIGYECFYDTRACFQVFRRAG